MIPNTEKILQDAFERYKERGPGELTISHVAKEAKLSYSTAYNPIAKGRKTSIEVWLLMMQVMGEVTISKKKICINLA